MRRYGKAPFNVAVVHGGPGTPGEMAPVARELASGWGVLEPLQTARSLEEQVEELKIALEKNANLPVALIGFSWGAWLSFIIAATFPDLTKKLILIGSGPFEERYAAGIMQTRLSRLSEDERTKVKSLIKILNSHSNEDKNPLFAQFGALLSRADAYDPIASDSDESDSLDYQAEVFQSVWDSAAELRKSGRLLELGKQIKCPVIEIHGDYDPHPVEGVERPLSTVLKSFRFVLLHNCGHKPWVERQARDHFYRILKDELQ